ncbi:MAG: hypothetical protein APR53_10350 [Methanoculleus sp. SDB]|nr:MAG: hypothetical protein APR53_10350 [Methanoculleus sp. SDB]
MIAGKRRYSQFFPGLRTRIFLFYFFRKGSFQPAGNNFGLFFRHRILKNGISPARTDHDLRLACASGKTQFSPAGAGEHDFNVWLHYRLVLREARALEKDQHRIGDNAVCEQGTLIGVAGPDRPLDHATAGADGHPADGRWLHSAVVIPFRPGSEIRPVILVSHTLSPVPRIDA